MTNAVTMTHTELNTVTSRGLIAGQTWTGTHTFPATTYGVTATLGDSSLKYATTEFVANTAFSSALPAQLGNSGKLLTTNGTTASWTATKTVNGNSIIGSGDISTGLVPLAELTPTAAANLDFLSTFNSSYDSYLIIGTGVLPAADDVLRFRVATAGAADAGSNYYEGGTYSGGTVTVSTAFVSVAATTTTAGKGCCFTILIQNVNDATNLKAINIDSVNQTNATPGYSSRLTRSAYAAANTVSGGRLYWSGGSNFSAVGKIRIYGIKNS